MTVVYDAGNVEAWRRLPTDNAFTADVPAISDRTQSRLDYQERGRQENIERITAETADTLSTETDVPDEHPADDWISRFFECAQDVSEEQMQRVWAQILAGEIKRPGSYSLRALDCLRNLSKSDADEFVKAGRFALRAGNGFIVAELGWIATNRDPGIEGRIVQLAEFGLLYPSPLSITLPKAAEDFEGHIHSALTSGGYALMLKSRQKQQPVLPIPAWYFTGAGRELLALVDRPYDEEYLTAVGRMFIPLGSDATIGRMLVQSPDGKFTVRDEKPIQPL